jgi:hypothetical protein
MKFFIDILLSENQDKKTIKKTDGWIDSQADFLTFNFIRYRLQIE